MKPQVIYMQSGFWQKLREDTTPAGYTCLMNVYNAISAAELRTDISDEMWINDPLLVFLWKNYVQGNTSIDLYEGVDTTPNVDDINDMTAVYLTDQSNAECEEIGKRYGVLAINWHDLPKKEYLFKGDGFLLEKHQEYHERFMEFRTQLNYPSNSLILIDPYILADPNKIGNHLYSLFDAILPSRKLEVNYHISIFSMVGGDGDGKFIPQVYETISNLIRAVRKGLKFDLTVYAIGKAEDFHRRMILTNNVYIEAGDGFDVFSDDEKSGKTDKSGKNAKFSIVIPTLYGNNRMDISDYQSWIKITKNRSRGQSEVMYKGSRCNRLFELV